MGSVSLGKDHLGGLFFLYAIVFVITDHIEYSLCTDVMAEYCSGTCGMVRAVSAHLRNVRINL